MLKNCTNRSTAIAN